MYYYSIVYVYMRGHCEGKKITLGIKSLAAAVAYYNFVVLQPVCRRTTCMYVYYYYPIQDLMQLFCNITNSTLGETR